MIHRNFSEPEVMLLVMLLRTLLFVSLRKYGGSGSSHVRGLDKDSLLKTLSAAVRGKSENVSTDIIKWRS